MGCLAPCRSRHGWAAALDKMPASLGSRTYYIRDRIGFLGCPAFSLMTLDLTLIKWLVNSAWAQQANCAEAHKHTCKLQIAARALGTALWYVGSTMSSIYAAAGPDSCSTTVNDSPSPRGSAPPFSIHPRLPLGDVRHRRCDTVSLASRVQKPHHFPLTIH